jgi:hypothetical protein
VVTSHDWERAAVQQAHVWLSHLTGSVQHQTLRAAEHIGLIVSPSSLAWSERRLSRTRYRPVTQIVGVSRSFLTCRRGFDQAATCSTLPVTILIFYCRLSTLKCAGRTFLSRQALKLFILGAYSRHQKIHSHRAGQLRKLVVG